MDYTCLRHNTYRKGGIAAKAAAGIVHMGTRRRKLKPRLRKSGHRLLWRIYAVYLQKTNIIHGHLHQFIT